MKIVLIFLVVGLTVICCVSDKEIQARERIRKSIKLEIGMTNGDVKKLIGEPDTVIFYDRQDCCPAYLYDLNDDSYGAV